MVEERTDLPPGGQTYLLLILHIFFLDLPIFGIKVLVGEAEQEKILEAKLGMRELEEEMNE